MAKNNLVLIALLSISVTAYAQHETLPPSKGEKLLPNGHMPVIPSIQVPEYAQFFVVVQDEVARQRRFLYRKNNPQGSPNLPITRKETVYTLEPDNMPCLAPDMQQLEKMPVVRPRTESRMPNAIPVKPLMPQEKEKRK